MINDSFWNIYVENEITPQIKYWVDLWEERVQQFPESKFGLKLNSPRLLFMDILDEVEFNGLRNEKLKAHFSGKIKGWLQERDLLNVEVGVAIELLSAAISSEKASYTAELCKQGLSQITHGSYFKYLLNLLTPLLIRGGVINQKEYEKIDKISQLLITEFMMNGYALKTCADFPVRIFDKYRFEDGEIISSFPTKHSVGDFKSGDTIDFVSYGKAVAEEVDTLTIEDRINTLVRLYEAPEEIFDFIFPLQNVKIKDEIRIGEVTIYSPEHRKFLKDDKLLSLNLELFDQKSPYVYANAIVESKSKDFAFSKEKAISVIESALDVLRLFSNADGQPSIVRGNFLVLAKDGQLASTTSATKKESIPEWVWSEAIDVNETRKSNKEDSFDSVARTLVKVSPDIFGSKRQIASALHWQRKAQQETHLEEQLLDHWIALEKLFSDAESKFNHDKFSAIISLVPPVYVRKVIYNMGWDTFYYLRTLTSKQFGQKPILSLPEETINAAYLNHIGGRTIHLQDFISSLGKISENVNRKIISDKIDLTKKYFTDAQFASKYLEAAIKEVETDLLIIYRYRNKIVHDAHYDDRLLPYYLAKIEQYCAKFLHCMLANAKEKDGSIYEWATKEKADVARIVKLLNSNKDLDLIKVLFDPL